MTVYNALLVNIEPRVYGSFLCTFCIKRDKFHLPIPAKMVATLSTGEYYNIDFDIMPNILAGVSNNFSFNFINPAKDSSHE